MKLENLKVIMNNNIGLESSIVVGAYPYTERFWIHKSLKGTKLSWTITDKLTGIAQMCVRTKSHAEIYAGILQLCFDKFPYSLESVQTAMKLRFGNDITEYENFKASNNDLMKWIFEVMDQVNLIYNECGWEYQYL